MLLFVLCCGSKDHTFRHFTTSQNINCIEVLEGQVSILCKVLLEQPFNTLTKVRENIT